MISSAKYERFLKIREDNAQVANREKGANSFKKSRIQTKRPSEAFKAQEHYSSQSWIKFPCFTALELIYVAMNSRVNLQSYSSVVI